MLSPAPCYHSWYFQVEPGSSTRQHPVCFLNRVAYSRDGDRRVSYLTRAGIITSAGATRPSRLANGFRELRQQHGEAWARSHPAIVRWMFPNLKHCSMQEKRGSVWLSNSFVHSYDASTYHSPSPAIPRFSKQALKPIHGLVKLPDPKGNAVPHDGSLPQPMRPGSFRDEPPSHNPHAFQGRATFSEA